MNHRAAGFFGSNGRKIMACPHCKRMLDVDIDEILPVHSKKNTIHVVGVLSKPEDLDSLCDGSWNTKGELIQFEIVLNK